jgi:uncharacterized protein with PQ loop repeat
MICFEISWWKCFVLVLENISTIKYILLSVIVPDFMFYPHFICYLNQHNSSNISCKVCFIFWWICYSCLIWVCASAVSILVDTIEGVIFLPPPWKPLQGFHTWGLMTESHFSGLAARKIAWSSEQTIFLKKCMYLFVFCQYIKLLFMKANVLKRVYYIQYVFLVLSKTITLIQYSIFCLEGCKGRYFGFI